MLISLLALLLEPSLLLVYVLLGVLFFSESRVIFNTVSLPSELVLKYLPQPDSTAGPSSYPFGVEIIFFLFLPFFLLARGALCSRRVGAAVGVDDGLAGGDDDGSC